MARLRSRQAETEDVNPRRLRRGAVKRQHIGPWAVGRDEIAPGVIGGIHLGPQIIDETHLDPDTVSDLRGVGQLLVVSATAQSIASGGDYVTADTIAYQHGFADVTAAGESIIWPVDAVGEIQVELEWDTYNGGGTVEIEVDGTVPAWGLLAEGDSGRRGCKRRSVHIAAGAVVKVKVTQGSGSAQTGDVLVEFSVPDPTSVGPVLVESFWVDSKVQAGATSTVLLSEGVSYEIVVTGNVRGTNDTLSFGSPDTVLFPSPSESAEPAGDDAETAYARSADVPLPFHRNTAEFSFQFDIGGGWSHLEPVDGPYSAPTEGHVYTYLITGEGSAVAARYFDEPGGLPAYTDNNGMLRVDIYQVDS